jgi:hypothetical protein
MGIRARWVAAAASALLLLPAGGAAAAPGAHRADGKLGDWRGSPTMLGGRTQVSRGELIHTDYLYDDYGADLNGSPDETTFRAQLARTSGDYRYPPNERRYGYNAADLRELRLALDRRALHVLVALQTLKARGAPIAVIAIDRDGRTSTGAGAWPAGAGLTTPGADRFITVRGSGARISGGGEPSARVRRAVNMKANAFEVDVPRRLLGRLTGRARVWVATGLAGSDGFREQAPGETAAFDLGFQGAETYGLFTHWGDERQSAALAAGAPAGFSARLRPGLLLRDGSSPFRLRPGFYNRIFRSRFTYGEGINPKLGGTGGTPEAMFRGRFQPYGLWIPEGYRQGRRTPLLIDGHSLDVNHNQYEATADRHLPQLGDERGSLVITPLARGSDTWYLDPGLVDVFEAWRDVRRHYGADRERTAISGYSMGGYMTYRLGLLVPDAFTRAAPYVGPPAYAIWPYPGPIFNDAPAWTERGMTRRMIENGLNLPYEINNGVLDELVPISGVEHQVDRFDELGNPYRYYRHPGDDHLSFLIVADQWGHTRDWLGNRRRNLRQVRVVYKRFPSNDLPRAGLRFDGAYWVDRIVLRRSKSETDFGMVDATTLGLGKRPPQLVEEPPTVVPPGNGGVSPATVSGQRYRSRKGPDRNAFRAELTNVRSVLFKTGLMGLVPDEPVVATLRGAGLTTLRFTRGVGPLTVRLEAGKAKRVVIRP